MSQKYKRHWTEEFRKGCTETGRRVQENSVKHTKEKSTIDSESLFLEEIEKYLADGGTIKVHPTLSSIPSYDLHRDESDYPARPERGYVFNSTMQY